MKELKFFTDQRAVTAAGTPERISESELNAKVIALTIRALTGNAGNIYVVHSAQRGSASSEGYILSAGETLSLDATQFIDGFFNLQHWWIDADNNGDSVCIVAFHEVL